MLSFVSNITLRDFTALSCSVFLISSIFSRSPNSTPFIQQKFYFDCKENISWVSSQNESTYKYLGVFLCGSYTVSVVGSGIRVYKYLQYDKMLSFSRDNRIIFVDAAFTLLFSLYSVLSVLVWKSDKMCVYKSLKIPLSLLEIQMISFPILYSTTQTLSSSSVQLSYHSWLFSGISWIYLACMYFSFSSYYIGIIHLLVPFLFMPGSPFKLRSKYKNLISQQEFLKDYRDILKSLECHTWHFYDLITMMVVANVFTLIWMSMSNPSFQEWLIIANVCLNVIVQQLYSSCLVDFIGDFYIALTHSQDVEQKIVAARKSFLRYLFHELRVPLNAILLGVQFLSDSKKHMDSIEKELLATIVESSGFIAETLSDVLVLQKLETGTMKMLQKPYSVLELLNSVTDNSNEYVVISSLRGIKIETIIDKDVPDIIVGDKFRIAHVLSILVSNAVKFSGKNSVITIISKLKSKQNVGESKTISDQSEADSLVRPENFIEFSVEDTGIGMSDKMIQTIFVPFTQTRSGDLKHGHGSGLSLAIAKEIIELLNGNIVCESEVGVGSKFTITVPVDLYSDQAPFFRKAASMESLNQMIKGVNAWNGASSNSSAELSALSEVLKSENIMQGKNIDSIADEYVDQMLYQTYRARTSTFDELVSPRLTDTFEHKSKFPFVKTKHIEIFGDPNMSKHFVSPAASDYANRIDLKSVSSNDMDDEFDNTTLPSRAPIQTGHKSFMKSEKALRKGLTSIDISAMPSYATGLSSRSSSLKSRSTTPTTDRDFFSKTTTLEDTSCSNIPTNDLMYILAKRTNASTDEVFTELQRVLDYFNKTNSTTHSPPILMTPQAEDIVLDNSFPFEQSNVVESCENVDTQPKGQYKVLIVDDVTSNRKILAMMIFREHKIQSAVAEDGLRALTMVEYAQNKNEPFDVIFLDNTMPNLTGIEFAKYVRAKNVKTIIIGVTGNSMEDEIEEFSAAGADAVITKPLRRELIDSLFKFMSEPSNRLSRINDGYELRFNSFHEWSWTPRLSN